MWLDGAHNPHGMTALMAAVASMSEEERPGAVVFSCLADKQPEKLTALMKQVAGSAPLFVPTIKDNPRAAEAADLARLLGESATAEPSLEDALSAAGKAAGTKPVLVCGSLYLLSELFTIWPSLLKVSRQAG